MTAATNTNRAAPTSRRGSRHTRECFAGRYVTLNGIHLMADATTGFESLEDLDRLPHPETISFLVVVFEDEITDEDRAGKQTRIDWLKGQPAAVQAAVLGGKRKRAALQEGLPTERQITTPWYVLQKRYEAQGVDVSGFACS